MTDDRALLPFDEGVGRLSGIYQIRNLHTGRVYIGKSRDIPGRWLAHRNALDRGLHVNDALQGDWEVYGERAFEFTVLEEARGLQALQNAEARHLKATSDVYNVAQVLEWRGHQSIARQPITPRQLLDILFDDPLPDWHIFAALSDDPDGPARDFAVFEDWGYRGLYAGETALDIAARKGLAQGEQIRNWMGPREFAANWFMMTQTMDKLQHKGVTDKTVANQTHYGVGREVRSAIERIGGTMPEDLPTPAESIQELERREQKRLEAERQPSLFAPEPTEAEGEQ